MSAKFQYAPDVQAAIEQIKHRPKRRRTDNPEAMRQHSACHEIAHALGGVFCGNQLLYIRIASRSGYPGKDGWGYAECKNDFGNGNSFMLLCGWAWENRHGEEALSNVDVWLAERFLDPPRTMDDLKVKADEFVWQHEGFIRATGEWLATSVAPDNGKITTKRDLKDINARLQEYIKPHITPEWKRWLANHS